MSAVELDRQGIERRDFPIVRRGYDPGSVDAHLRALAAEVEELRREAGGRESLAASAGLQVQGILEAAQATAETIEREAAQDAQRTREAADADARRTREEAIAKAREHVESVSKATASLLELVGSMDAETRTLIDSLHTGASRLAGDLAAVGRDMEALYDAPSARQGGAGGAPRQVDGSGTDAAYAPIPVPPSEPHEEPFVETQAESHEGMQGDPYAEVAVEPPVQAHRISSTGSPFESPDVEPRPDSESDPGPSDEEAPLAGGDLDGARLVALNMALNGDSREETGRYLAENFEVSDPDRLLDEVYAAIEG
jgi:DivIVA domain-containing protein